MSRFIQKNWQLVFIVLLAFSLRLYKINTPLADWHSFRQADTASVTRQYTKGTIDLLRPTYHDLGNIQSGKDNPHGYRMVEFPLINAGTAVILKTFSFLNEVIVGRCVSILFSLGTVLLLYTLVKKISGNKIALLSSLLFAILPFSVFYSRVILPEPAMVFFSMLSLVSFYNWVFEKKISCFITSMGSLSTALLLKPFVVFLGGAYAGILIVAIIKQKFHFIKNIHLLIIYGVFSFTPLLLWRNWIQQYPSGIPASDWLFNGNNIRWRPAWFRWLFYERITKIISGFGAVILFPLALIQINTDDVIYGGWWLGIFAYFSLIATGNVQHDYYQIITIPIICITLAKGLNNISLIIKNSISINTTDLQTEKILVLMILLMTIISWKYVAGFYNVNHWEYVEAGKRANQILPHDAKVIAPAFGDTIFLFQTNRVGWPIGFDIEEKINKGAEYYIATSFDDETNMLLEKYTVLEKNNNYAIIDLTQPKTASKSTEQNIVSPITKNKKIEKIEIP